MPGRRLGFIVPSVNAVFEPDCRRRVPARYGVFIARASCSSDDQDELAALAAKTPAAACDLADAAVDAIVLACTSGSLLGGHGYDDEISRSITTATGVPATTSATAVRDALLSLGVRSIVLITPYEEWLNRRMAAYLGGVDITIAAAFGFGMPDPREHERVEPSVIAERAMDLCHQASAADAVLISCTSFQGMKAADLLRRSQPRHVVSSNDATIWAAARLLGEGSETFDPGVDL